LKNNKYFALFWKRLTKLPGDLRENFGGRPKCCNETAVATLRSGFGNAVGQSVHLNVYSDKGTLSKTLNFKQPLSLKMIRLFSKMLRLPAEALLKECDLH